MRIDIPYGNTVLPCDVPESRLRGVLTSKLHELKAQHEGAQIVKESLKHPIGSPRLCELARGKRNVVVLTSDHTRPVPSGIILPLMLEEIRSSMPDAAVTVLVATGGHRPTTHEELVAKFGKAFVEQERIVLHDCRNEGSLVHVGTLPSGGALILNRLVVDADLLVSDGFIEPHFFAGYSGGRKAVLPGVASYRTVLANHCAEFIAHECARTGILEGNPIHRDMLHAAETVGLAFICNVVIDSEKRIVAAFSGDRVMAHEAGCAFVGRHARVHAVPADIVVTSNGGYPLDQNLYQAVKSMTAAEATCKKGGVIIVASECGDGHGGEAFYRTFEETRDVRRVLDGIMTRGKDQTEPDQWQIQIFLRVLMAHPVIMVTAAPREMVEHLGITWAASLDDAFRRAEAMLGNSEAGVTVIPDGVSVIVDP